MRINNYRPLQSLQRMPVVTGGICGSIIAFPIEDVLAWPKVNPNTGIIDISIALHPGKQMYIIEAVDKGRSFEEETKYDAAGPYMDMQVQGTVPGVSSANVLTLDKARWHQWAIIVKDRSGYYRLIGSKDCGARIDWKYTTGDIDSVRKTTISWKWQSPMAAKLYQAATFNITIGGVIITAGKLTLIQRFQAGASGSPMADGQGSLTNPAFAGKKLLLLIDGVAIPVDDGSGDVDWTLPVNAGRRHYQKTLGSDTITLYGAASYPEIFEIYEIG